MTNNDHPGHRDGEEKPETLENETIRLLHQRASVRAFEDRPIPDDVLEQVLTAGIHAPTGGNLQPYSIVKITEPATNRHLAVRCGQEFIGTAPVNLLFCLDYHRLGRWAEIERAPYTATSSFRHFWIGFQDVIIAAQNICTAADALGLGSVYIGTVVEFIPELRQMFDLPSGVLPVVLLCLGWPKHRPAPRPKLPVEVCVHDGHYRRMSDAEIDAAFDAKFPTKDRPQFQMELTPERRTQIEKTARRACGVEFARRCMEHVDRFGWVPMPHRYFGLHYRADEMPADNERFLSEIAEAGFSWFEGWTPAE